MPAEKRTDEAHREAVRRVREQVKKYAYKRAKAFAERQIDSVRATTEIGLALYVQAELMTFFAEVVEPMASTSDGLAWAKHCARSCGGQASGKAQRRGSLKGRVVAFAIPLHERDPLLTKADIRRRFLNAHPGDKRRETSVGRYLNDLW